MAGHGNLPPEDFLRLWEEATKPTVEGRPVLRYALLHPDRTPVEHTIVHGVDDDAVAEWCEQADEEAGRRELEAFVASRGGRVEYVASRAARLAMVRDDGAYRVLELDAEGVPTGHHHRDTSLGLALRWAALCYGHPPGTLCWKEMLGSPVDD